MQQNLSFVSSYRKNTSQITCDLTMPINEGLAYDVLQRMLKNERKNIFLFSCLDENG